MMTALSPISTFSRMMAPGSMRAWMPFLSSMGTPVLRPSFSTTWSTMASPAASSAGASFSQSPKTTLQDSLPKTWSAVERSTSAPSLSLR